MLTWAILKCVNERYSLPYKDSVSFGMPEQLMIVRLRDQQSISLLALTVQGLPLQAMWSMRSMNTGKETHMAVWVELARVKKKFVARNC